MSQSARYVLITPTRNEEALIGQTIDSVVHQTMIPIEWVLVDDGSTDRTGAIIGAASKQHPWIRRVTLPPHAGRNFAAVVQAVETGVRSLAVKDYDYLGLVDSDVRFEPDYFHRVIEAFVASPRLGLAGGLVIDPGEPRDRLPRNRQDVPGAAQFFRRSCFDALGDLIAIPEGGWDVLTCLRARMCGYETRLLTHLIVDHLKPRNVYEGGALQRHWQMGIREYALGYHPLFELIKCFARVSEKPIVVSSVVRATSYCYAACQRRSRLLPADLLAYLRNEQKKRLRHVWLDVFH